jgi:hypothetical protein
MSMANQKIEFKYTADPLGHLVVGSTRLVRNGVASTAMARYEYDADGRLFNVSQQEVKTAGAGPPNGPRFAGVEKR